MTSFRTPVIMLETTINALTTPKATLQQIFEAGRKTAEVAKSDGSSFEGLLHTIHEFTDASSQLSFDTGPELFTNFRLCLTGSAKDEWDNFTADLDDEAQTEESFDQCVDDFKRSFVTTGAKQTLLDYLQQVQKPFKMDVRSFANRVQTLNRYASKIPDDAELAVLTASQLKNVVFNAMPNAWREHFFFAGKHLSDPDMDMKGLVNYMETICGISNNNIDNNNNRNRNNNSSFEFPMCGGRGNGRGGGRGRVSNYGRGRGQFHQARRQNNNGRGRGGHDAGGSSTRVSNDATCPIHVDANIPHKWGMCIYNPHGNNYKPVVSSGGRAGRGNGRDNAQRGGHNGCGNGGGYSGPNHQTFYHDYANMNAVNDAHEATAPGVAGGTQTNRASIGWETTPHGALLTTCKSIEPSSLQSTGAVVESKLDCPANGYNPHGYANSNPLTSSDEFYFNSLIQIPALPMPITTATNKENVNAPVDHVFDLNSKMFHVPLVEERNDLSAMCDACVLFTSVPSDDILSSKFDVVTPTMEQPMNTNIDMVPSTLMVAGQVQEQKLLQPLKILFDTGSNISLLNSKCLPVGAKPTSISHVVCGITAAGSIDINRFVFVRNIVLPEFSRTKRIPEWKFCMFDTDCPYDAIVGRDFLTALKIDPCFSTSMVNWEEMSIPFKPRAFLV